MSTKTTAPKEKVKLDADHLLHLLRQMIMIRHFEDKCAELYQATKIRGFMHLYNGEEAVAVGVMAALKPEDNILCTYREHGHALARGVDPGKLMAEMYGKLEGCCRGRGGSMHIFDAETRFYGGNAIVAGHLPLAAGFAQADKMLGRPNVSVCFLGDGAVAEGEFHESLNLAKLWDLPVLYIIENNLYCMGTAIRFHNSNVNLWEKGAGYNVPAKRIDGMDVLEVEATTKEIVEKMRAGGGPFLLEIMTFRYRPHSMFDAELYRSKSEVEEWKKRDPIMLFTNYLKEHKLIDDAAIAAMEKDVDAEVQKAVDYAEAGTWEPVEELTRFVYTERRQA